MPATANMRSRYLIFVIASAAVLLFLTAIAVVMLPRTHVESGSPSMRIAMVIVTSFLIATVLRYLVLLWLGYLHHVEAKTAPEEHDRFEPLVTIIVPAYNEAA